jgi:acetyl-CoA carboxylase carboxyl transferase subunit beta
MNNWFQRVKKGITTSTKEKKETPEGLWQQCDKCKTVFTIEEIQKLYWVCDRCSHHGRIGSEEYFQIIFDDGNYTELNAKLTSGDPLKFEDTKKYKDRIKSSIKNTGLYDAIRTSVGKLDNNDLVIACMDFSFIGGSLGSVVGEKIARAIDHAISIKAPFIIISKSGGARMMEAGYSLMQMAKVSGKLGQLSEAKLPYISLMTNPTTGGVTASYAMLGDINIAEPCALIGFAGPRVVKETIGRELPDEFQTSEFLLEHGFLDFIVHRNEMRDKLALCLKLFKN